ncbi:MAG: NAD(P)-dependent oxidoreductase [Streptosporangiaceae bacterium]|jgi:nucleoside-diphosphate-sugar epimerase
MRLMIIGASGFLGAHVRQRAAAAGAEVRTAGRSELADSPGHRLIDLAETDPAQVAAVIAEVAPDVVVNCAGAITGTPETLTATNITGVYTLTKAMLLTRRRPRLVHLGSAAEYGRAEPGVPVTEQVTARPGAIYGVTKLAGTRLVELAVAAGLDAVVLRVFNPVGPGAHLASLPGRLAAELRQASRHGTDVRLGSLDGVRDFVDVRDVADAAFAAATAAALPHAVLNIGSGRGVPVAAMVKQFLAISGCTAVVHEDAHGPTRSPDIPWQQADISRAVADLGWTPHRDLVESLTDLWQSTP